MVAETQAYTGGFTTRKIVGLAAAGLAIITVIAVFLAIQFVQAQRARDLQAWQVRLGIVADSRVASIEEWLERQFATVQSLAANQSLPVYLQEIYSLGPDATGTPEAEYLHNFLTAVAGREGFSAPVVGADVPANVARIGIAGLALVDRENKPIVATRGMPPLTGKLRAELELRPAGKSLLIDMHKGPDGKPSIGFVAPIFASTASTDDRREIGAVIGVRPLNEDFFNRLLQPGDRDRTAETYLVRFDGNTVQYISPLKDGTPPLSLSLDRDTADLAAVFAALRPGGFGERIDYGNRPVLITGRAVAAAPWILVRKIDAEEAMWEIDQRARTILVSLLAAIFLTVVIMIAVWRHATSLRSAAAARQYFEMANRFEALSIFLRLVTDRQPTEIAAFDSNDHYTFANQKVADTAGIAAADIRGKPMATVLGPAKAKVLQRLNRLAVADENPISQTHDFSEDGVVRVIKSDHIPITVKSGDPRSCLMVLEDVTELVAERERSAHVMRQLVQTLVVLIDRRDPWSADHCERVSDVASAIAGELGLSDIESETAQIAGVLMNLGKILVPRGILTKTEKLTEAELRQIRESVLTSADLLDGVPFEGPVVETLRQIQEHWDGSGLPLGLSQDSILMTARIIAVANAFVGMVSPRAHRAGLGVECALETLQEMAGRNFDRRVVIALINHVENRGGRAKWEKFEMPPAEFSE